MNARKGNTTQLKEATLLAEAEDTGAVDIHAPRKMTVAENAILTIKVLAGFGLLGAAIWGINSWTAPQ